MHTHILLIINKAPYFSIIIIAFQHSQLSALLLSSWRISCHFSSPLHILLYREVRYFHPYPQFICVHINLKLFFSEEEIRLTYVGELSLFYLLLSYIFNFLFATDFVNYLIKHIHYTHIHTHMGREHSVDCNCHMWVFWRANH